MGFGGICEKHEQEAGFILSTFILRGIMMDGRITKGGLTELDPSPEKRYG